MREHRLLEVHRKETQSAPLGVVLGRARRDVPQSGGVTSQISQKIFLSVLVVVNPSIFQAVKDAELKVKISTPAASDVICNVRKSSKIAELKRQVEEATEIKASEQVLTVGR